MKAEVGPLFILEMSVLSGSREQDEARFKNAFGQDIAQLTAATVQVIERRSGKLQRCDGEKNSAKSSQDIDNILHT